MFYDNNPLICCFSFFCHPMTEHISAFVSNLLPIFNVNRVYDSKKIYQVEKNVI